MSHKRLVYLLLGLIIVYCAMRQVILEWQIPTDTGPEVLVILNRLVLLYNGSALNYGVGVASLLAIGMLRQVKLLPQQSIDDVKAEMIKQGKIIVASSPKDAFSKVFKGIKFKKA